MNNSPHLPVIFMFSGQGSQYYHMGKGLFEENKIFKHWMLQADKLSQEFAGISIIKYLYSDQVSKSQPFARTLITHPAIFMVEYGLMQVLLESNIRPDYILGTSMGEFAAAVAAGILSFESALQAVISQALAIERCSPGGMLAILENPNFYHEQPFLHQHSEMAAINFPSHFVVSGSNTNLNMIIDHLKKKTIAHQLLPVSQAFHSSLIDSAKTEFLSAVQTLKLQTPNIPFISCAEAKPLTSITSHHCWNIVRLPIQFQNTIQSFENHHNAFYLDVGPSGTLATFVKYNLLPGSKSKPLSILTPLGDEIKNLINLLKILGK